MQIYLSGLVIFAFWLFAAQRSLDKAFGVTVAFLPLGMLAVMRLPLGGMTPLIAHVAAAATVSLALLALLRRLLSQRMGRDPILVSPPSVALLVFGAYMVVATAILPRLFQGDVMVFPFDRGAYGERVSHFFRATVVPLGPSTSNISQGAYVLLGIAFYLLTEAVLRRRGVLFGIHALRRAAIINLILGAVDFLSLDVLLGPLRTADYALHNEHAIAGVSRVIGGFAEAAAFGSFSATLGAFFLIYGLGTRNRRDVLIGGFSILFAAAALSSTAILGVLLIFLVLGVYALRLFIAKYPRQEVMLGVAMLSFAVAAMVLLMMVGPSQDLFVKIFESLTVNKSQSMSGLERGAMARQGLVVFLETWGLGGGVGSVRSNGFGSAMLGSLGIPGAFFFGWFVWRAFFSGRAPDPGPARVALRAAQVSGFIHLMMMGVASFSIDPGLLLMFLAAVAFNSKRATPEVVHPHLGRDKMVNA